MANLHFSSVLLHPLKPIIIKKCQSIFLIEFLCTIILVISYYNDLMMMMAIEVCNLHDKVHTYYAAKVGSKI